MASFSGPLRVPGFARLVITYTVNDFGDQIGLVAAAILVLDRTGSALAAAALFVVARSLPALIAPLLAAALERRPTNLVLPGIYALEALAFAGLAVLSRHFWLPAVLAIALVDGVLALAARSVTRGTIGLVLRPTGQLREGNNLINVCFSVSNMVGPAVGGVVVAAGGPVWGLGIDAALFAATAAIMAWPGPWPTVVAEGETQWFARLREGMSYVRTSPDVGRLIRVEAISLIPLTLVIPVLVVLAKHTLHAGDAGYGALQAVWGSGVVIGSLLLLRVGGGSLRGIVGTGLLAVGVSYVAIGVSPNLLLACVASVVGGIGNGVESVTVLTAVQSRVAEAFMGRVAALLESLAAATMGVGFALGGLLTSLFDPRVAYVVSGAGVLLCAPLFLRVLKADTKEVAE
jgi:MFS family permease